MIIIKMWGGLGNQISQYAFGRLMRHLYPDQIIKYDNTWFNSNSAHNGFELTKVFREEHLKYITASEDDISSVLGFNPTADGVKNYVRKGLSVFRKMLGGNPILTQKICSGYPQETLYFSLSQKRNWYMEGTWHNYNYTKIRSKLINELQFNTDNVELDSKLLEDLHATNSVSIHIRLGDYCGTEHQIISKDYYVKAIQLIKMMIADPQFYVFSDDITHAKDYIPITDKMTFIEQNKGKNSWIDMMLMSKCKHNIIANSTFSYWAAILNSNPNKKVVQPVWYAKGRKMWRVKGWFIVEEA